MSISPLNLTTTGDTGAYVPPASVTPADPVVSTVAAAPTTEAKQASDSDVATAVKALNGFAATAGASLDFSLDEDTGIRIVKVVDRDTKTVIRQIPTEEAVAISKSIDKMQGLFINQRA